MRGAVRAPLADVTSARVPCVVRSLPAAPGAIATGRGARRASMEARRPRDGPAPVRGAGPPGFAFARRRREQELAELSAAVKRENQARGFSEWQRRNEAKWVRGDARRKADSALRELRAATESRRERLRAVLEAEVEAGRAALEPMGETELEREAEVRGRGKALREKREEERKRLADRKWELQWR
ncbi:cilia- and flagella-associated protein 53-like [Numida meleagris]|nr:cilia- and flagella-associated protein 53-like [Numida meleagris]